VTPSIWSVLVIFVLAPLGIAAAITAVVLLLASPTRRPVIQAVEGIDERAEEEASVGPIAGDGDAAAADGDPPPSP
jgi:hypothetical protein